MENIQALNDVPIGWRANEERLLCLIVLDDDVAKRLSATAGEAFYRGFIVQNRESGDIVLRQRFRYLSKDSWEETSVPGAPQQKACEELKAMTASTMKGAAFMVGVELQSDDMAFFEPPDDNGDFMNTVNWLSERELIYATVIPTGGTEHGVN